MNNKKRCRVESGTQITSKVEPAPSVLKDHGSTQETAPAWRGQMEYLFTDTEHGLLVRWRRGGGGEPWTFVMTGPGAGGRLKAFPTRTEAMNAADAEARKAGVL